MLLQGAREARECGGGWPRDLAVLVPSTCASCSCQEAGAGSLPRRRPRRGWRSSTCVAVSHPCLQRHTTCDSCREPPSFSGRARGVRVHPRVCVHQVFRISLSSLRPRRWGRGSAFRDRAFPVLDGCWSGEVARSRSCAVAGQSPGPADLCVTCSGRGRTRSVALSAKALGWQVLLLWLSSRTPGPRAVSAKPQARLVRREKK